MFCYHVHFQGERCIPKSIHAGHMRFRLHTQRHAYVPLFGTSRFSGHLCCFFVFCHHPKFLLNFPKSWNHFLQTLAAGGYFYLSMAFFHEPGDPARFLFLIPPHTKEPVRGQLFSSLFLLLAQAFTWVESMNIWLVSTSLYFRHSSRILEKICSKRSVSLKRHV